MRYLGRIAVCGCVLALAGLCAIAPAAAGAAGVGAAAGPAAAKPALWRTYDMIVNLHDLPRTYTCDQLWYEFHGILLRLGAWPYSINILPYHCSPNASGSLRSPDVQVGFQLPFFLHGVAAKSAPAKAVERTISLSAGKPDTLHAADCQIMQQISQTLLASLPVRLDGQHFDCSAPPRRAGNFAVTVSLPVAVKIPVVAATSGRGPR